MENVALELGLEDDRLVLSVLVMDEGHAAMLT